MVNEVKSVKVKLEELGEKLNYLEYVVENTEKVITLFKDGPLKGQTESFLELVRIFKDAIDIYRNDVLDQVDMK